MSIENLFEQVAHGKKLTKEEISGSLINSTDLINALRALGVSSASGLTMKRIKQKQSGNVQTELYEADVTSSLPPILALFFKAYIVEIEANYFLKENAYSVVLTSSFDLTQGGRNGTSSMNAPRAISYDDKKTWKKG